MSLANFTKQHPQPKVHFSEYLKTENTPAEEGKPTETGQPEPKEEQ